MRAGLFGQTEIILDEGVLGAVPAAGHALATLDAAGAVGADATEVGIRDGLAGCLLTVGTEEHPDRCRGVGVTDTHLVSDLLHDPVGIGEGRILDHAEHPLGLVVVRHQFRTPVGDV